MKPILIKKDISFDEFIKTNSKCDLCGADKFILLDIGPEYLIGHAYEDKIMFSPSSVRDYATLQNSLTIFFNNKLINNLNQSVVYYAFSGGCLGKGCNDPLIISYDMEVIDGLCSYINIGYIAMDYIYYEIVLNSTGTFVYYKNNKIEFNTKNVSSFDEINDDYFYKVKEFADSLMLLT